jgi:hypothetical protein
MTAFKQGDRVREVETGDLGTVTEPGVGLLMMVQWDHRREPSPWHLGCGDISLVESAPKDDTADKWKAFARLGEAMHRITQTSCGADTETICGLAREIEVIADRVEAK